MRCTLIVPVDNRAELVGYFLDNFARTRDNADHELVIVSDDCRDSGALKHIRKAERELRDVKVLVLEEKHGYGRAVNLGAQLASTDTLVFVNSDVFPEPGCIDTLVKVVNEIPNVGAAQGLLIYPQSGLVQSTGHVFSPFLNFHALEGRSVEDPLVLQQQDRQGLTSAMYAMRRDLFDELGGFDEFYFNAWEGLDLSLQVTRAGLRCLYVPSARAFHVRGGARRHYRLDEMQQTGYFWHKWGTTLRNDLPELLKKQVTPSNLASQYFAINCGSTHTWLATVGQAGLSFHDRMEVLDRFESKVSLYENLPHAMVKHPGPLLFVADHFEQLSGNRAWFASRGSDTDLVADLRGNLLSTLLI